MVNWLKIMRKEVIVVMKAIRIFLRNIRDGFKSVGRNLSLSIASISCITITLLIVATAIVVSYNVENMTKLIREDFTIVTFINTSATDEQINDLEDEIKKYKNVESIEHETKTQIADEMKNTSDDLANIIDTWSEETNPLYDTLLVKVKDTEKISKKLYHTGAGTSMKISLEHLTKKFPGRCAGSCPSSRERTGTCMSSAGWRLPIVCG